MKTQDYKSLLAKIDKVTKQKDLDLSSDEDLSIGIMNLISIEEHLFFTSQKTGKSQYLDLLNEVRLIRTELLKKIIKDYEGEVWCISKHLLSGTMRLIEVGTKELKKGNKRQAQDLFNKAYKLYSLFWGINLGIAKIPNSKITSKLAPSASISNQIQMINDTNEKRKTISVLDRLGSIVKKAVDCCRE